MSYDEIKELVQLLVESGIAEIEVQRGDQRVRIRRSSTKTEHSAQIITPIVPAAAQSPAPAPPNPSVTAPSAPAAQAPPANEIVVKSPIVGTYYDAPKPGDPPFVRVGDSVEPGQVLCIIESMKLMNEIESEVSGIVASKLMENARPVEYGEALFVIRPR